MPGGIYSDLENADLIDNLYYRFKHLTSLKELLSNANVPYLGQFLNFQFASKL